VVVTKRSVRIALIIATVMAAAYFIWLVRSGLYPFIIALFLAYLLNPAVCYLEKKGPPPNRRYTRNLYPGFHQFDLH